MSFSSSCKVSGAVGARGSESRVLTLRTVPFRTKSSLNGSTNGCRASEKKSGNKNKLFISLENGEKEDRPGICTLLVQRQRKHHAKHFEMNPSASREEERTSTDVSFGLAKTTTAR